MKNTAFNKKITLLKSSPATGEKTSRAVWACVYEPSLSAKKTELLSEFSVSLAAVVRRAEYEKTMPTHVEIGGRRYKIVETAAGRNPREIKIFLSRDG